MSVKFVGTVDRAKLGQIVPSEERREFVIVMMYGEEIRFCGSLAKQGSGGPLSLTYEVSDIEIIERRPPWFREGAD